VHEPSREILIKMGKPQSPDGEDWYCPIQITGIGNEKVYRIFGADAIQAIELAMRFLGSELHRLNTQHQGRIQWSDAPKGWFGFPIDTKL
jgi:hypothetical protein